MFRSLMAKTEMQQRLLCLSDGERRMTNVLHLMELLHTASTTLHLGPTGLLHWLGQQRANARARPEAAQGLAVQVEPHLHQLPAEGVAPGVLAENELGLARPDRLGTHDLVRECVLQHAVLMDTRLVGERVGPHDRLVSLDHHAGHLADQPAGPEDLLGLDAGPNAAQGLGSGLNGHHRLLQGGITGPLTQAIDGAFNLTCTTANCCEAVRNGHAEVVMAVR